MSISQHLDNPLVVPIHEQSSPNEPIEFGSHELSIRIAPNGERVMTAQVRLRFRPDDALEFRVIPPPETHPVRLWAVDSTLGNPVSLCLKQHGIAFEASRSFDGQTIFTPIRSPLQVGPKTASSSVIFHLFNWPKFRGPHDNVIKIGTPPLQGAMTCGCLRLETAGWKITVSAMEKTDTLLRSLEESGGYAITHVGKLERLDSSEFTLDVFEEIRTFLFYFFSFVFGRWTAPCLSVGFDCSGQNTFEEWGLGNIADGSWNGASSWFDQMHSEMISDLLPGFSALWTEEVWRGPLIKAIYWYVSANQVGQGGVAVDSALLFTQAALELISWTYCVNDRKIISARKFKELKAADALRIYATSECIPVDIPLWLEALTSLVGKKWEDSMDAITKLRNGLVHPKNSTDILPDDIYYEAWCLSQRHIELAVLRLCRYNGNHADRTKFRHTGQVEKVPWAPK